MILIITHKEDYTADYVINILNQREIPYHRLNTDDIGIKHNISFVSNEENVKISIDDFVNFKSIWFRRTKPPNFPFANDNEKSFFTKDFRAFLNNLWASLKIENWISHPKDIYNAENKLYQLKLAKKIGFTTPKTIVSTDKKEIEFFYRESNGQIIIKPLFGGRYYDEGKPKLVFTNKVKKEHILNNTDFVSFPMVFQEEIIKKYELRVTIVNGKVFTAKIDSQSSNITKLDWRKDRMKFTKYDLPNEISEKCKKIVGEMNLKFGAIDLIKTESDYIFLEINPNGQWVWIENDTGLKISDEIINYLIK
ncbi:hypothetical protein VOI54_03035 [Tamlana sp. 2201CG12-4]|uniref:MvdC/MvdD family ATP grasp protein n=1 Tax=Tamlana sp. 2201CG12-4 TaxID=3112582 RepID=UPI002DB6BEA9|nr:hypothetical protein [Tamlana sp. 2201CG12-4]MEC3905985.1 hypothetical protein [Tamlana sp. 2201CG12-4]